MADIEHMAEMEHMIGEALLPASQRDMIVVESYPLALLKAFENYQPVTVPKWL